MDDILLPAYQKLYAALNSLERFNKGQDLFENIACIDSFLSEFRNITFVLQKSLAHTDYKSVYESYRDKHLKNDDCAWLVEKRNLVLKESPFALEKTLKLTLFFPNEAGVFSTESYTIEDEKDYSELIDMVKRVIEGLPAIEVFFSVEFVYGEKNSKRNIFSTIDRGIESILGLLLDLNRTIGRETSEPRKLLQQKIEGLHFHCTPKEAWFVDDYVYYRKDNVFEKGERYEILTPFKTAITYSILCEHMHVDVTGNSIEDSFNAFTKMHIVAFMNQKKLMPTIFTLREDGVISMAMYEASIKTTTYRKIKDIADDIISGEPIVAVFHVSEMLIYQNADVFNKDYSYRSKDEHSEILSFNIVTKDYSKQYCISSEALTEEKENCMFPHLTQVETDDSISFMNPIVQAFKNA